MFVCSVTAFIVARVNTLVRPTGRENLESGGVMIEQAKWEDVSCERK